MKDTPKKRISHCCHTIPNLKEIAEKRETPFTKVVFFQEIKIFGIM